MNVRRTLVVMLLAVLPWTAVRTIAGADSAAVPITTDVLVLDANDRPVAGVRPSEVDVLVDGAPVPVSSFLPAPPEVSVVLIADVTMSQPLKRYEIQNAIAATWLQSLIPADRARLAVLGSKTILGPWLTADRVAEAAALRALIGRAEPETSPLWDAVAMAAQTLADAQGSKAVILLTDGRATANTIGLDDAMRIAMEANVSVSSVSEGSQRVLPQAADTAVRVRTDTSLQLLADATGGLFLPDGVARRTLRPRPDPFAWARELSQTPNRPGPLLAQVMSTLRQRYRLVFEFPTDGRTHTLDVRVRRPGVAVRARTSYVAGR